ncbi:MAG: hypothetical protein VKK80_14770, partial [Prochlorothrix sp.]|nr:hypothetical protein [Prochlorothrix sp.]
MDSFIPRSKDVPPATDQTAGSAARSAQNPAKPTTPVSAGQQPMATPGATPAALGQPAAPATFAAQMATDRGTDLDATWGAALEPALDDQAETDDRDPADLASEPPHLAELAPPPTKGFWEWFWQFWLVVTGIMVFGLGGGAVWSLVRIPQVRDCSRLIQPFASASLKLYCAQIAAGEQTREDLLNAIDLVDDLPEDHPLRASADRYIQQWAFDLILLAETHYNEGNLAAALATLEDIPLDRLPCDEMNCPRDELLSWEQTWRETWDKAEEIYKKAERALLDQDWDLAAATATELLSIKNQYWQVTKYNEINAQIQEVRDTNSAIARAKRLAEKGGVANLLEAIKLAQTVEPSSKLHSVAQAQVLQFSRQILDV